MDMPYLRNPACVSTALPLHEQKDATVVRELDENKNIIGSDLAPELNGIFPVVMIPLYIISNGLNMHGALTSYWPRIINHRIFAEDQWLQWLFHKDTTDPDISHSHTWQAILYNMATAKVGENGHIFLEFISTDMVLSIAIITRTRQGPFQSAAMELT